MSDALAASSQKVHGCVRRTCSRTVGHTHTGISALLLPICEIFTENCQF